MKKDLIHPELLRRIPRHFSWIDHRLIRDGYVKQCSLEALALYLILITVADAQGLSYYSDSSLCKMLQIDQETLEKARRNLIRNFLVAYKAPIYQVLDLNGKIHSGCIVSEKSLFPPKRTRNPYEPPADPIAISKLIEEMKRKL